MGFLEIRIDCQHPFVFGSLSWRVFLVQRGCVKHANLCNLVVRSKVRSWTIRKSPAQKDQHDLTTAISPEMFG